MNGKDKDKNKPVILAAMPGTKQEIIARTGLSVSAVSKWLVKLRASGDAHVGGWQRAESHGAFMPRWVVGPGADVPCKLKPLSKAEIWARYRKKAMKDGSWDIRRAKKRASYRIANIRRDSLVSALFGNVQKGKQYGKEKHHDGHS